MAGPRKSCSQQRGERLTGFERPRKELRPTQRWETHGRVEARRGRGELRPKVGRGGKVEGKSGRRRLKEGGKLRQSYLLL